MSFRSVTSDDQGNLYAISNDDELFYYRDEARNGSARWAFDGVGQKIGNGWGDIHRVFSGGDGILYAITWDGHLLFFRDEARDGSERWAFGGTGQDLGRAKTPDGADAGWLAQLLDGVLWRRWHHLCDHLRRRPALLQRPGPGREEPLGRGRGGSANRHRVG
jgi:Tachylectin